MIYLPWKAQSGRCSSYFATPANVFPKTRPRGRDMTKLKQLFFYVLSNIMVYLPWKAQSGRWSSCTAKQAHVFPRTHQRQSYGKIHIVILYVSSNTWSTYPEKLSLEDGLSASPRQRMSSQEPARGRFMAKLISLSFLFRQIHDLPTLKSSVWTVFFLLRHASGCLSKNPPEAEIWQNLHSDFFVFRHAI